ncbi:hypothetical protein CASFOL_005022 [Castilleja foliolosa]|uniref:Tf2-1-like SH3-like domain-containing protein n=1 Tax=Castilleja foliolosa TaxID=1961234 RepID=A0ABD3E6B8_9LAMI
MLWLLQEKHYIRHWLAHAEFAYNQSRNRTTGKSPFQVVYGRNPHAPIDLVPIPVVTQFSGDAEEQAARIRDLHEQIRKRIVRQNDDYKRRADKHRKKRVFQVGDLVWIHLCKERFPVGRFGKLQPRADGPFRILERINDNAYKVDLPGKYNVSATFNVSDLSPYISEEASDEDSWSSLSQQGESFPSS